MKKKIRKISIRKTFNMISIVFLTACILIYGFRFLTLYIKNNKKMHYEANTLGKKLRTENKDILEKIDGTYYFKGDIENNYVSYSGLLWRVIKIEEDNSVVLISENSITLLASGEELDYDTSSITEWMNKTDKENSGKLESSLNNYNEYLIKGNVCNDKIDTVSNSKCNDVNEKYYINLLTMADYVNTGASEGFINNGSTFYLSDYTSEGYNWYINNEGKTSKNKGTDIYGIRPVIKLKSNAPLVGGDGTKDNPYLFDSTKNTIGAYVTLNDDHWRVIGVDGNNIRLAYDGYVMYNGSPLNHKFSTKDANFEDEVVGTLAYYLNNGFYEGLSYKDLIVETEYFKGYYGSSNNYDYISTTKDTIKTKVALMSIGDIIYNNDLTDYFIMNSSATKNTFVYVVQKDTLFTKAFSSPAKVVPVITIDKTKLIGTGTKSDPYRLGGSNEKEA